MAARQLVFDLLARDKTGAATTAAAGHLQNVGDAAEMAAKHTEKLGKESDRAEDQVQRFGKSSRTAAEHVDDLDGEIGNVNRELLKLAVAWKEAESAADRADLSKAIRRAQRDLRELERARATLAVQRPIAPDPEPITRAAKSVGQLEHELVRLKAAYVGARSESQRTDLGKAIAAAVGQLRNLRKFGESAGSSFLESFGEAATAASPLAAIGAGMAIGIAPLLGATVAAGLLGGAGAGGIVGGLLLAKRDQRVKSAAKSLGNDVLAQLDQSAASFVPATLGAIGQIGTAFQHMRGDLDSIFANSSRYVGPLVAGLTGLIGKAVDGAEKAVRGAGPVFDALERNLPRIGDALGDVLASLADNGPEAAVALGQVFDILDGGIRVVGGTVNALTELYGFLASTGVLGEKARQEWLAYTLTAGDAGTAAGDLADKQGILADQTLTAADAAKQQQQAIESLNKMLRAQVDPLFGLLDAQDRVTAAQGKYDKAVREHGKTSAQARAASRDLAESLLDVNDKASQVGATADAKLTPAMRRVLEQGGATKTQIKAIETELGRAKKKADQYDGINARAKFSADTATAAARVGSLLAQIGRVRSKSVTIRVGVIGASAAVQVGRILSGRAEGGDVEAGTPYIVGEHRPEVFVPKTSGTIVPSVNHPALASMGAKPAGAGGGGWIEVRGDALIVQLTKLIASHVSAGGGRGAQLGIRVV